MLTGDCRRSPNIQSAANHSLRNLSPRTFRSNTATPCRARRTTRRIRRRRVRRLNGDAEAVKDKEKKGSKKDKPAAKPASKPAPNAAKPKPQRKIPAFDEPPKGKNSYLGGPGSPVVRLGGFGGREGGAAQRSPPRKYSWHSGPAPRTPRGWRIRSAK